MIVNNNNNYYFFKLIPKFNYLQFTNTHPSFINPQLLASSCKYGFSGNITIDTAEVDILNVAKPSILTFTKQKHYYKWVHVKHLCYNNNDGNRKKNLFL